MRAFPFFFLVLIPVGIYFAYRSWKNEQKRRELLMQWCASGGYEFTARDDQWCSRWPGTPFGQGDNREARNIITGKTAEQSFAAFDYSYETHSSDSKGNRTTTTHRYAVTAVHLPVGLPTLQVTPESIFSRIGNVLGLDDVELESEDFNRRFRVHADDRKFASDVLSPRTMQALLSRPEMSWRITGADILSWQDGKLAPAIVLAQTSGLQTVVAGIPSFVWKDHS